MTAGHCRYVPRFRSDLGAVMVFNVMTAKPRLLFPLIWKTVKWVAAARPIAFGLMGLMAFGAYEVKKTVFDSLSLAIKAAGIVDTMESNNGHVLISQNERWYEAYLDGFHYLPAWIGYLTTGRKELLQNLETRNSSSWFGDASTLEAARVMRAYVMWDVTWATAHPSRVWAPWTSGGASEKECADCEPVASLRLRFLDANEAFGSYCNSFYQRSPYLRNLIATGQLRLTAADQARAERRQAPSVTSSETHNVPSGSAEPAKEDAKP